MLGKSTNKNPIKRWFSWWFTMVKKKKYPPLKFNSSPLKSYRNPKTKRIRLPVPPFFQGLLLLNCRGVSPWTNPSLVGGFNPSEKYESKWESSPNRGENKTYLKLPKPPASYPFLSHLRNSTERNSPRKGEPPRTPLAGLSEALSKM